MLPWLHSSPYSSTTLQECVKLIGQHEAVWEGEGQVSSKELVTWEELARYPPKVCSIAFLPSHAGMKNKLVMLVDLTYSLCVLDYWC